MFWLALRSGYASDRAKSRPRVPQPKFLPFRDRGLRHQPTEDDPTGGIQPVTGQRVDDLAPDPLLELIEIIRRLRTTTPRKHRHDGKRGCGFTTAGHARVPFQIERQRLTRNPRYVPVKKFEILGDCHYRARR
jgi:hypothetical protein